MESPDVLPVAPAVVRAHGVVREQVGAQRGLVGRAGQTTRAPRRRRHTHVHDATDVGGGVHVETSTQRADAHVAERVQFVALRSDGNGAPRIHEGAVTNRLVVRRARWMLGATHRPGIGRGMRERLARVVEEETLQTGGRVETKRRFAVLVVLACRDGEHSGPRGGVRRVIALDRHVPAHEDGRGDRVRAGAQEERATLALRERVDATLYLRRGVNACGGWVHHVVRHHHFPRGVDRPHDNGPFRACQRAYCR